MHGTMRIFRSSQTRYILFHLGAALSFLLAAASPAAASNALRYMPEDALGFVLVKNLENVDSKVSRFTQLFGMNSPAPLTFAKFATGLNEGIRPQGDLLVALLPGSGKMPAPQPMVLLPVNDYAKFAASIHGDASGEICRVAIAGESVLVAKFGEYALLMDVEHRETLRLMLGLQQSPVASLKPLDSWLDENDIVIALLPQGLETILGYGKKVLAQQRDQLEGEPDDLQLAALLQQTGISAEVFQWILESLETEIDLVALAISLDENTNLRVSKRVLLKEGSRLNKLIPNSPTGKSHLLSFEDRPFIWSGKYPISPDFVKILARALRLPAENDPKSFGLEGLTASDWDQVEQSYALLGEGVHSLSVTMLPGETGDPLASHVFGIVKVENAKSYFKACQQSIELWDEALKKTTSDTTLKYEFIQTQFEGLETYEIRIDIGTALRDPNAPLTNWLLEAILGEEDKLRIRLIPMDEETIFLAVADDEETKALLSQIKKSDIEPKKSAQVTTTTKLLPNDAPTKLLVSPQGSVVWVKRIVNEFLVHLQDQTPNIPDFDPCPPLGLSLDLVDARFESDLVVPVETLKALAVYIQKFQAL